MHGDSMEWFPESKDNLPLTWWKQQPVYLAAVLALGGVASMVLTALLMALNQRSIGYLVFSVDNVAQDWRVWTPFTYVLVNRPGLMFLLSSYLFWSFGEAIERHLGRRSFVKLVLSLVLVTPLLLGLLALFGPRGWSAEGMGHLEFGVFLAFAALYPTARISIIILTIEAWVMATAIVAVDALSCLSRIDWAGLLILAGQVAMADVGIGEIPKPLRGGRHGPGILKMENPGRDGAIDEKGPGGEGGDERSLDPPRNPGIEMLRCRGPPERGRDGVQVQCSAGVASHSDPFARRGGDV